MSKNIKGRNSIAQIMSKNIKEPKQDSTNHE